MAAAWAIALVSSVLGAGLRLDGGIRAEGRSRTLDAEGAERLTTAEVSATPRVGAELEGPDGALRAQYAPTLRAPDVLTSASPDVLHVAELRARLRLGPPWSLTAAAAGERGRTDLVAEARLRQTVPEAIPTTAVLRYASVRADLALEGSFGPRTRAMLGAGAYAGGGDDAASRSVMPTERGLRAAASLEWSATPRDVAGLQASGVGARFMGYRQAAFGSLGARWHRRLARTVEGRIGGGALASWSEAPGEPTHRDLLPTGEAGVAHASERHHLSEEGAVRLGAGVDRISGTVNQQVELAGSARWAPVPAWSLGASVAAALVRQGPVRSRRGAFEVRAEWGLSPQLTAALGLYGHWQRTPDPALPSFVEGGAFLAVSLALPRR